MATPQQTPQPPRGAAERTAARAAPHQVASDVAEAPRRDARDRKT
ncbi:MAG: hypothetical protein ACRDQ4_09330 [Pseudonocardiaceae bacterium]